MIASGVIARVLRILPTAQAATTKEAIAKATASRSVSPVLPLASAATPSQIAARNPAEARPRTIAGPECRTADTLLGHVRLRNGGGRACRSSMVRPQAACVILANCQRLIKASMGMTFRLLRLLA